MILASASPQRSRLLRELGCQFEAVPSRIEEQLDARLDPEAQVLELAYLKARDVAERLREGIVIGADTLVVISGRALGKPESAERAREMLRLLGGREHLVITGLAVIDAAGGRAERATATTRVRFGKLDDSLIEKYIATGEPLNKAGAYAIQGKGALLVESIEGCYFNVVGLPLYTLERLLARFGISLIEC